MDQTAENVIVTRTLSKSFGNVQALESVNLTVPQNSIFGHDISSESVAIRERIDYLPQQPNFIETMTARENLDFAARFFFKGPNSSIAVRCQEMLELVGLADKANRPIRGFSLVAAQYSYRYCQFSTDTGCIDLVTGLFHPTLVICLYHHSLVSL